MSEKTGAVMVVGGGISGVQTSLDLAESGFKVYLIEKTPSIGGVMGVAQHQEVALRHPQQVLVGLVLEDVVIVIERRPVIDRYAHAVPLDAQAAGEAPEKGQGGGIDVAGRP